jgi:hypothetical protein
MHSVSPPTSSFEVGARAMLDGLSAQVERWRPDLLVHESFEFARRCSPPPSPGCATCR